MAATTNINGWNVGGNNNSFDQRGHFYRGVFSGNVTGMLVKQNSTPNMTVLVEHGSALLNKNTISASVAEIKADTSVTIDTANTANPRIDTVVIYEDTSVAIPSVEADYWQDGAGGRFKIVSLPGTAAASPVASSDASIQSAIGAGKPWARLADITVPANSTTILNSNIADKRKIIAVGTKSVDANGWTVYDHGGWKEYAKMFVNSFSATTVNSFWSYDAFANQLLPVGVSSLDDVFYSISGRTSNVNVSIERITPVAGGRFTILGKSNSTTNQTITSHNVSVILRTQ